MNQDETDWHYLFTLLERSKYKIAISLSNNACIIICNWEALRIYSFALFCVLCVVFFCEKKSWLCYICRITYSRVAKEKFFLLLEMKSSLMMNIIFCRWNCLLFFFKLTAENRTKINVQKRMQKCFNVQLSKIIAVIMDFLSCCCCNWLYHKFKHIHMLH